MAVVIGVTGTLGAGKGEVAEFLIKNHGFKHFTFRGYFIEQLKKRGTEINRDTITAIANELRATLGEKYFDEVLAPVYASGENYVVESIRTPSEVAFLRKQNSTFLVAVDATIELRYERIYKRGSETDTVPFERFKEQEEIEMRNTDPNKQNLEYCIKHADFSLSNEGDMNELHIKIQQILQQIAN